jgi:VWFA-related protein
MVPVSRVRRVLPAAIVLAICAVPLFLQARQTPQPPPDPQRPVFRGGAYFVTVDVYPLLNGRIATDLTAADFEVYEDGQPQKVENFEFVQIAAATPDADLRDPDSLGDMRDRLADPRARVFVLYLDTYHIDWFGAQRLKGPMVQMMSSILAPADLFGVTTPQLSTHDITFGRKTSALQEQVYRYWPTAVIDKNIPEEGAERMLENCYNSTPAAGILGELFARRREDMVLTGLESLVDYLGAVREGRKSIFIFSPGWRLFGRNPALTDAIAKLGPTKGPPLGITSTGKLVLGDKLEHGTAAACDQEVHRLAQLENDRRMPQLLRRAASANVSFYPVDPVGVGARSRNVDNLRSMASETDGSAVVMTNDLVTGLERVADALSAYYLLGYSSTNTRFDGSPRRIEVKVKRPGIVVKARRGYLAPTEGELSRMRSGGSPDPGGTTALNTALSALARIRAGATLYSSGRHDGDDLVIVAELGSSAGDGGEWKQGAEVHVAVTTAAEGSVGTGTGAIAPGGRAVTIRIPVRGSKGPWHAAVRARSPAGAAGDERLTVAPSSGTLLGEAAVWRSRTARAPLQPAGALQFARNERVRIEWPVRAALDRRQARLLDRNGQPLAVPVTLTEREAGGQTVLAADIVLLPLGAADYVVEVEAGSGSQTERQLLAIRVGK